MFHNKSCFSELLLLLCLDATDFLASGDVGRCHCDGNTHINRNAAIRRCLSVHLPAVWNIRDGLGRHRLDDDGTNSIAIFAIVLAHITISTIKEKS